MFDPLITLLIFLFVMGMLAWLFWPDRGLFWEWQRNSQLTERVLSEDALKYIHSREMQGMQPSVHGLAGKLKVSQNRAAEVLSRLEANHMVDIHTGSIKLTEDGREYALRIIRAHRLYERYLADETGFEEAEWHEMADRFEHRITTEDLDALSMQLGHPTHDPHGDPIPTRNGAIEPIDEQPLTALAINEPAVIVHIEDEPEAIYAQLVAEGLLPGMEVRLLRSDPQRVRFWAGGDEHVLAPIFAANLLVRPMDDAHALEPVGEPLSVLRPGERGRVVGISQRCRGVERRRMMDLGILPGTVIQAELESPGGDPVAYRIRDAVIALRGTQAENIRVDLVEETV